MYVLFIADIGSSTLALSFALIFIRFCSSVMKIYLFLHLPFVFCIWNLEFGILEIPFSNFDPIGSESRGDS